MEGAKRTQSVYVWDGVNETQLLGCKGNMGESEIKAEEWGGGIGWLQGAAQRRTMGAGSSGRWLRERRLQAGEGSGS